jgi:hypothetical protein
MPNTNNPRGLVPLKQTESGYVNQGLETCYVAAGDATPLYVGDPVTLSGSADAAGVIGVTRAGVNGPFKGVVAGFVPDGTTNMLGYRPASTAAYVLVHCDQDALFEVQADTALAAADIGLNASLVVGSGSAYSKVSGFKLDAATKATTATLGVKIVGLSQKPGNDFGAYNKVLVRLNQHTDASASAGL